MCITQLNQVGRAPWPARDALVTLLEAGRMRQPREPLPDRTHLSEAHTQLSLLFPMPHFIQRKYGSTSVSASVAG